MNRDPTPNHRSDQSYAAEPEPAQQKRSDNNQISKNSSPSKTREQPVSTLISFLKQTGLAFKLLQQGGNALLRGRQVLGPVGFAHLMMGTWAVVGATATVLNLGIVELLERQTQTVFFQLRGTVSPPDDIVILAIDESSLEQAQFYRSDPNTFAHLEPIAQWPWQRSAYAIASERLLEAGAKTVALDLIFDTPSSWGADDDAQLLNTIENYPGRLVLASSYEDLPLAEGQGTVTQLIEPATIYRTNAVHTGFINYWIDFDRRIHRLSHVFPKQLGDFYPDQQAYFQTLSDTVPSFDVATLEAAQIDYPLPKGDGLFYFGPAGTFEQYSFWTVIEPSAWEQHLNEKRFANKIVLIGPTATLFQDLHNTPFGILPGIEIHANAIATLMSDRAIANAIPNRLGQWIFIIGIVLGSGLVISSPHRLTHRMMRTGILLVVWGGVSAIALLGWQLIFPTAIPLMAIAMSGLSYVIAGLVREKLHRLQLRKTLKQYSSSPIIREIISQQDDLQDLLNEREHETLGKMLAGRYQLVEILGAGGFGETYIAADLQRPGQPLCVVKQLRPITNDLKLFTLSQRLFRQEAQTLERLGKHPQIPQLLAYFEEGQEFYLVQEFINGHPLRQELLLKQQLTESEVVKFLTEILLILDFIHQCGVIHRDIKPSNIIRRQSDQKLVIIDFGAVKEMQAHMRDDQTHLQTISIGTRGYMPSEQFAGTPRFNSDLYAVGVLGIQALTGLSPDRIDIDSATGELMWHGKAAPSLELKEILTTMTRYSFRERYQSAQDVLRDLDVLLNRYGLHHILETQQTSVSTITNGTLPLLDHLHFQDIDDDESNHLNDSTLPWPSSVKPTPDSEEP
ncbi:MAG: serine/threonine-protein kinase [Cyanobacteria bacterium P01_E01_bin.6]